MEKTKNSHVHEYRIFKSIKPSMALADGENFADWQRKARAKLAELLGLPLEVCDGSLNVEWTEDREDHTEYRFTVETEPGYIVPCHLLIPKKAPRPLPLTVCLSGHCNGMHIALGVAKSEADEKSLKSWHHRAMAPRSLREGRAALVIEARSFGESSALGYGTSCTETAKIAILSGRTLLGERVWDAMRVLDAVLDRFGEINPDDILCTGNSGGGTATYYLACMDERITTAAPSCSVCSFESSIAAHVAAPDEMPTSTPSLLPISLPVAKAFSLDTGMISS